MNHESDHTVDATKKVKEAGLLELFDRCNYLYHEAFYANTELAILRELSKASSDYENEVICAGCFFSFTQLALTESCFMNCARLFDSKSDVSIGNLIEDVSSHSAEIDALAISLFNDRPNFDRLNPIVHPLAEDEERFYPKEVESQRSYEKLFGDHYEMVTVCITTHDLSNLWKKRLNGLSKLTDMLRDQRNKVFAHSDMEALNYDELVRRLPLTYGEIQKLIDFALDLTIELLAKITGIEKDRLPKNCNDIQGLLNYVKVGMEAVEKHLGNL